MIEVQYSRSIWPNEVRGLISAYGIVVDPSQASALAVLPDQVTQGLGDAISHVGNHQGLGSDVRLNLPTLRLINEGSEVSLSLRSADGVSHSTTSNAPELIELAKVLKEQPAPSFDSPEMVDTLAWGLAIQGLMAYKNNKGEAQTTVQQVQELLGLSMAIYGLADGAMTVGKYAAALKTGELLSLGERLAGQLAKMATEAGGATSVTLSALSKVARVAGEGIGVILSLGAVGLDIWALTQSDSPEAHKIAAAQLGVDSAMAALTVGSLIAAAAGASTAAAAMGAVAPMIAGLGIGVVGLVGIYVKNEATSANSLNFLNGLIKSAKAQGYNALNPEEDATVINPEHSCITSIDLKNNTFTLGDIGVYQGQDGGKWMGWTGAHGDIATWFSFNGGCDPRKAPVSLYGELAHKTLAFKQPLADKTLLLPAIPQGNLGYKHQETGGWPDVSQEVWDNLHDVAVRAEQRGERFNPIVFAGGNQAIYDVQPHFQQTSVSVSLDKTDRQILVPRMGPDVQHLMHYELQGSGAHYRITLPGVTTHVTLKPSQIAGERWTLDCAELTGEITRGEQGQWQSKELLNDVYQRINMDTKSIYFGDSQQVDIDGELKQVQLCDMINPRITLNSTLTRTGITGGKVLMTGVNANTLGDFKTLEDYLRRAGYPDAAKPVDVVLVFDKSVQWTPEFIQQLQQAVSAVPGLHGVIHGSVGLDQVFLDSQTGIFAMQQANGRVKIYDLQQQCWQPVGFQPIGLIQQVTRQSTGLEFNLQTVAGATATLTIQSIGKEGATLVKHSDQSIPHLWLETDLSQSGWLAALTPKLQQALADPALAGQQPKLTLHSKQIGQGLESGLQKIIKDTHLDALEPGPAFYQSMEPALDKAIGFALKELMATQPARFSQIQPQIAIHCDDGMWGRYSVDEKFATLFGPDDGANSLTLLATPQATVMPLMLAVLGLFTSTEFRQVSWVQQGDSLVLSMVDKLNPDYPEKRCLQLAWSEQAGYHMAPVNIELTAPGAVAGLVPQLDKLPSPERFQQFVQEHNRNVLWDDIEEGKNTGVNHDINVALSQVGGDQHGHLFANTAPVPVTLKGTDSAGRYYIFHGIPDGQSPVTMTYTETDGLTYQVSSNQAQPRLMSIGPAWAEAHEEDLEAALFALLKDQPDLNSALPILGQGSEGGLVQGYWNPKRQELLTPTGLTFKKAGEHWQLQSVAAHWPKLQKSDWRSELQLLARDYSGIEPLQVDGVLDAHGKPGRSWYFPSGDYVVRAPDNSDWRFAGKTLNGDNHYFLEQQTGELIERQHTGKRQTVMEHLAIASIQDHCIILAPETGAALVPKPLPGIDTVMIAGLNEGHQIKLGKALLDTNQVVINPAVGCNHLPVLDLSEFNSQDYISAIQKGELVLINQKTQKMIFIKGDERFFALLQLKFADGIRMISLENSAGNKAGDNIQPTDNEPAVWVNNPLEGHRPLQFV